MLYDIICYNIMKNDIICTDRSNSFMRSEDNSVSFRRQISASDMFWGWLLRWRSLVMAIIIGAIIGFFFIFWGVDRNDLSVKDAEAPLEATKDQSPQSGKEGTELTANLLFLEKKNKLSEAEKEDVNNLFFEYKEYKDLQKKLKEDEATMTLVDRLEMVYYLVSIDNVFLSMESRLTKDQVKEYNNMRGVQSDDVEYGTATTEVSNAEADDTATNSADDSPKEVNISAGKSSAASIVLYALFGLFVHMAVFGMLYILKNKLKYTDDTESILGCSTVSKIVSWDSIDSKNRIDRFLLTKRYRSRRKLEYKDALAVCVNTISDMMDKDGMNSIAFDCGDLKEEAEEIKRLLADKGKNDVRIVSSLFENTEAVASLSNVDGAIILAKVNESDVRDLMCERVNLSNRRIPLVGTIVYIAS